MRTCWIGALFLVAAIVRDVSYFSRKKIRVQRSAFVLGAKKSVFYRRLFVHFSPVRFAADLSQWEFPTQFVKPMFVRIMCCARRTHVEIFTTFWAIVPAAAATVNAYRYTDVIYIYTYACVLYGRTRIVSCFSVLPEKTSKSKRRLCRVIVSETTPGAAPSEYVWNAYFVQTPPPPPSGRPPLPRYVCWARVTTTASRGCPPRRKNRPVLAAGGRQYRETEWNFREEFSKNRVQKARADGLGTGADWKWGGRGLFETTR